MLPQAEMTTVRRKKSESLVILPVYNEMSTIKCIVEAIKICYNGDVLVIDDNSTDGSFEFLAAQQNDFCLMRNLTNAGAGGVLLAGFAYAQQNGYKYVVTMDSDGQHNACQINEFLHLIQESDTDMVWGTRYPAGFTRLADAFKTRQDINRLLTKRLCDITGWHLTDSFCGFRCYRVEQLGRLLLRETGYGMLLELAVKAWKAGLSLVEHPVPLIYIDELRDFNSQFQDAEVREKYYGEVIDKAMQEI